MKWALSPVLHNKLHGAARQGGEDLGAVAAKELVDCLWLGGLHGRLGPVIGRTDFRLNPHSPSCRRPATNCAWTTGASLATLARSADVLLSALVGVTDDTRGSVLGQFGRVLELPKVFVVGEFLFQ